MSSEQSEYPPFVTVVKTSSKKWSVVVMEWCKRDERYEAHRTSYPARARKDSAEADAHQMAKITNREYREFAIC